MENIFLSIVPIGEACHVRTHLNNWFGAFSGFLLIVKCWQTFPSSISVCCGRTEIHLVGINNLCLLLKVEGLLVTLNLSFFGFVWIILFIVCEQLRVRITDKSISAASISNTIITSGEFRICKS